MALQFIPQNPGGIGGPERRIIRSHVMRGKNVGKQRQSIKRKKLTELTHISNARVGGYVLPRQVLWGDLCFTSFPQQLDSESTGLMHRWFFDISDALFPPQFCAKYDIIKSIWVNCILADEAYFHSTLAISASYVDFCRRKPLVSSKTLHHISQAYALVNTKLSGPFSVSDSAIAAVISLAIYQQIHHQPATGLVHLHGLYHMIQLRGGIGRLMQENRALALKSLRLDIELAMQNGTPPIFDEHTIPIRAVLCLTTFSSGNNEPIGKSPEVSLLMLGIFRFAALLNEVAGRGGPKLDPLDYTETILSFLYSLVEASPLMKTSTPPGGHHADAMHLAMLAFMTTLLPEYTRDGPTYSILSVRLSIAAQHSHLTASGSCGSDTLLLLWILFIAGISVLNLADHHWLSQLIFDVCGRLNLHSWDSIQRQLAYFPWIFALHETPGRYLWEDIVRSEGISYSIIDINCRNTGNHTKHHL
ncbi:hypothetical protein N7492_005457 [Penicillium capsulatum]|uniref:Transcription factor domain-containing protein n=1 Tax=Penicillium capsulatum TaxID=69766 RepID=A0A9W9IBL1_9EURO|nr:hypothetical protein N7492_005457 [Penicillium capsulatum]KAJ6135442.1 hypothetical protein N7512_000602 [Penicillium capsulatum]